MATRLRSCLVLAVLTASCVFAHSQHRCMHDSDALQASARQDLARGPVVMSRGHDFQSEAVGSIRFRYFTPDLDDTTQYCTTVGQTVDDKLGTKVTCTGEDVLTTDKRNTLLTSILPAALTKMSDVLSHNRIVGNILVPQGACSKHTIPAAHSTSGVSDADYVLYISSVPAGDKVLAWAAGCRKDATGKYVVGRANFAPKYLNGSADTKDDQVATAVHELMHALGFSGAEFEGHLKSVSRRGKAASVLTLPKLAARVREHVGCNDASIITGAEIEDEGGSGSAGSHFDRRILKDELMAAAGGEKMSPMVLSVMEELFNYTVDYTKAEHFEFGRFAGCSFVTQSCSTTEGGKDEYFCFDSDKNNEYCDFEYKGIGYCNVVTYTSALPAYFQYFSNPNVGGQTFLDGCPVVLPYANRICSAIRDASDLERTFGFIYRGDSRCWATTGLIDNTKTAGSGSGFRCLQSRCKLGYPQVRVAASDFRTCMNKGDKLKFKGWDGEVVCPDPVKFCTKIEPPELGASPVVAESAADATDGLPALPSTAGRSEKVQVRGILTFSGSSWRVIVRDFEVDIRSQVLMSIALLFQTSNSNMEIDQLSVGSLVVHYDITSLYTEGEVYDRFFQALQTPTATGWMRPLSSFYTEHGGTDTITVTGHDTKKTYRICEFANVDDDTCFVIIAGGALCIIILALVIVWACCCRKSPEQKAKEAAEARRLAVEANEPIVVVKKTTEKKPAAGADGKLEKKQAAKKTEAKASGAGKKQGDKKQPSSSTGKKVAASTDKKSAAKK